MTVEDGEMGKELKAWAQARFLAIDDRNQLANISREKKFIRGILGKSQT